MSWGDAFWWPHQVSIQSMSGGGGMSPRPGATRTGIRAEVRDEHRLVRTTDNREVVSSSTVTVPLDTNVRVGDLVTVWPGSPAQRTAAVLAISRDENGDPLPSHLILSLE